MNFKSKTFWLCPFHVLLSLKSVIDWNLVVKSVLWIIGFDIQKIATGFLSSDNIFEKSIISKDNRFTWIQILLLIGTYRLIISSSLICVWNYLCTHAASTNEATRRWKYNIHIGINRFFEGVDINGLRKHILHAKSDYNGVINVSGFSYNTPYLIEI